ncbi:hypothetical protein ACJX0J_011180, partial [Zea mays]
FTERRSLYIPAYSLERGRLDEFEKTTDCQFDGIGVDYFLNPTRYGRQRLEIGEGFGEHFESGFIFIPWEEKKTQNLHCDRVRHMTKYHWCPEISTTLIHGKQMGWEDGNIEIEKTICCQILDKQPIVRQIIILA